MKSKYFFLWLNHNVCGKFYQCSSRKSKEKKDVLKLMIQTETLRERKVKDYQNPCDPPEVPPQYKSRAERRGDTAKQEQEAVTNFYKVCLTLMCEVLTKS
jgi:hypothetical protein